MHIFITGGAGFIGVNLARHHLLKGDKVKIFDNFSRKGAQANAASLVEQFGRENLIVIPGDVANDFELLKSETEGADLIYHCAGQVAVTHSVTNPRADFEANAIGTFNVLEAMRLAAPAATLINSSTNKVYGGLEDVKVIEGTKRYQFNDFENGIPETRPLHFHSPYGCCYSANTDILTRRGWKKFHELVREDEVLTYNLERKVAEYQRPTAHFAFPYKGKMYVQNNRRLKTCVTPNHKMLVAWDRNHTGLENPRLIEARLIKGKPMAYLLAAEVPGGRELKHFVLPEIKPDKHKHHFPARAIPMHDWLRFLGWYISEGHCYENKKTGNCTVTLTTYYRTAEAVKVMRAVGLSPVVDKHHVTATSKQLYECLKTLGKSHTKHIPQPIKELSRKHLGVLLQSLLDGDGNIQSKNSWRYTTVSPQLADDVQEIAIKCGMAASVTLDRDGFYRVYIGTTRTAQCNLDNDRSKWIDYIGKVYCVEVPNSVVMVRQNGHAYFSGNSKGAADQYVRDYARIYGLNTVVFRKSCIYGPHQMGVEDQGWVAWFALAAHFGKPITIYGNGKQVRDVLHINDLIAAYEAAAQNINQTKGQVYNIGGGPNNTLSLLELLEVLEQETGRKLSYRFSDWRPGDQPVYVSDIAKARNELGWEPKINPAQGVKQLASWIKDNEELYKQVGIV